MMDFYWLSESSGQAYYNVAGGKPEQYLPAVHNPECGHTYGVGVGPILPIDPVEIPGIEPYLKRAKKYQPISPAEWMTLKALIAKVTAGTELSRLPISPGMRCGPLDITYTCRKDIPDYMLILAFKAFSDRLTRQVSPLADVLRYPVSAQRKSAKKDVEQTAYFELVPLTTAKYVPISEYRYCMCPICGFPQSSSYRYAILDTTGLNDVDVVRSENGYIFYSERFKQQVEAAGFRGFAFIPSWRMSSDRSPSEVLNDMEFERQTGRPPDVSRPAGS
jgi:hypothetical protein